MNVDSKDARSLTKDLQNLVHYRDLITLKVGEAIARIGTDIVRLKNLGPLEIPDRHFRDAIIEHSHKVYYKPAHIVRDMIRQRDGRWDRSFTPLTTEAREKPKELVYDEF